MLETCWFGSDFNYVSMLFFGIMLAKSKYNWTSSTEKNSAEVCLLLSKHSWKTYYLSTSTGVDKTMFGSFHGHGSQCNTYTYQW